MAALMDCSFRFKNCFPEPSLFKTFLFGKYRGKKIADILYIDRPYIELLLEKKLDQDIEDQDWIFTLKYHLDKK